MPAAQGYIGRNPADSSTVIARQSFSPTGIQTDFTFAAGYSVGYVDLYLNGARLVEGQDFTATDGSTVGLTTNAVNGDVLEVVAFNAFNATNVTASGGNFTVGQNLTVSGTAEVTGAITATGGVVGDATGLSGTPDITVRHLKATGISTVSDTTQSTTTTSGAMIVSGGLGVAKNLFVGGSMNVAGTLTYEDVTNSETPGITTTGGLVVTGLGATFGSGVGIADSIYHIDDSNTAIRFPAADTFTVETGGDERIRFTSGPTIGIGDNNPNSGETLVVARSGSTPTIRVNGASSYEAQLKLQADGTATDTQLIAAKTDGSLAFSRWTGSAYTERVRVSSAGSFGIGTNDPEDLLHIKSGAIRIENAIVSNNDSTIAYDNDTFHIKVDPNNVRGSSTFKLDIDTVTALTVDDNRRLGVNTESPTSVFDVQVNTLAGINFTNTGQSPLLDFRANNVETAGRIRVAENGGGAEMLFFTKKTDDTLTEAFRVDTSQRVLIGTTSLIDSSTASNLQIASSSGARLCIARNNTNVTGGNLMGAIDFYGNDSDGTYEICGRMILEADGTHTTDAKPTRMAFYTTPSASDTATERVRITSSGQFNVGSGSFVVESDGDISTNVRGHGHIELDSTGSFSSPKVKLYSNTGNAEFAGTVSDSKGDLRKIIHKQETSAYTLVAADAGKAIEIQGNLTVPNSVFAAGDAITIINDSSSDKTISKGTGLTYMFNTADGGNANLTLGGRGMATIYFVNSTTCYISGSQLS